MSLDVYLYLPGTTSPAGSGIYVREDGQTKEITRAEWDEKFPGREPVIVPCGDERECVYEANVTHNLNRMADAAGIYEALWRPDEMGITKACDLVPLLKAGLEKLAADPEHFKTFNPTNGWGSYEGLVEFVAAYLQACERYPTADVRVSR